MRSLFLLGLVAALAAVQPATAQPSLSGLGGLTGGDMAAPVKSILSKASDAALDKLAKPGAFASDSAIRIALPGPAGAMGGMMPMAGPAAGGDIASSLNEAAGQASSAAEPIFRAAIDKMTMQDAMGLKSSTGATDYLRKSAGDQIRAELEPLVRAALEKTGVLSQISRLSSFGVSEPSLIDYVAAKTSDGIFTYMGREEARLRQNPFGSSLGR
jgi:hypothetical protein